MFGFYISIPFTKYKSNNINNEIIINDNTDTNKYVSFLIKEMKQYQNYYNNNQSVYVGGKDPLSLSYDELELLLKETSFINNIEYTFEIDPANYDVKKINLLKKYNVNRLSIKASTFSNKLLKILNKPYTNKDIIKLIRLVKKRGFHNINIDLNFNIPTQTIKDINYDIDTLNRLNINHISYYELDIVEGSILNNKYKDNKNTIKFYEHIVNKLKHLKYEHYEISHFTKNKKYSLQNIIYWTLEEYVGIGLDAHSFINNYIKVNNSDLNSYYNNYVYNKYPQNKEDNIKTYLLYGLSQFRGINIKEFKEKYKFDILKNFPKLNYYIENELLSLKNHILKLTSEGTLYSSLIFEVFI